MLPADQDGCTGYRKLPRGEGLMRIMILHMRFHPDLTGTGPLVTDLATDLVKKGNEVTVITSMPHYGRREIPPEYRGRLLHRSDFNGIDLWRTCVYVPANPSGFQRGVNYLSYTFMSIVAGLMAKKPDVILCVNPPITVGFSRWLLSLVRRAPMVFNVQDVWPDCLVIIDKLRSPLLIRIFKFLENDPHIQFLIVGEGNAKAGLVRRAGEMGLKNVRFLPTQPKEVLPQMLGAADLSLVTLNRRLGQLNVPSKTYSIMASARPVLASVPENSEIARLVEVAGCGEGVPPEDPQSLARAIKRLSRQPEKLRVYGTNGRRYVEECLARRRLTTQYHNLLREVVDSIN